MADRFQPVYNDKPYDGLIVRRKTWVHVFLLRTKASLSIWNGYLVYRALYSGRSRIDMLFSYRGN